MQIHWKRKFSLEVSDTVVDLILSMYPEEKLFERPLFVEAKSGVPVEFSKLKEECEKVLLSWQMFFLEEAMLRKELLGIEARRQKVSDKLFVKRRGSSDVTSKRIIDRLIRCQSYLSENGAYSANTFCGSLVGLSTVDAAAAIVKHFTIDMDTFRGRQKDAALRYLVRQFEDGSINVCQGVLTNKILPHLEQARGVYKGTSGFAIQDDRIPFVFIPSEINPDERDGRQIYTLVYLIVLVGLNAYEYIIRKDFKAGLLRSQGQERKAHDITSEFLLPRTKTETLKGRTITEDIRDTLAGQYKITPTAVIVILRKRGLIPDKTTYESLLPERQPPSKVRKPMTSPNIDSSVRKFNGKYVFETANTAIKAGTLTSVPAQLLLLGVVNKKNFRKYKKRIAP